MQYNKRDILDGFKIGFEFEFFSKLSRKKISKDIAKACGVKVTIPEEVTGLNQTKLKIHSDFKPTKDNWKLEKDFSGGEDMSELVTGPTPYHEARVQLIKILNWIQENGWTTKKTGIHINIGIDYDKLRLRNQILTMDRLKFCLDFNEDIIYKKFPHRKDNVYAKSIKTIYPVNRFNFNNNTQLPNVENYITPNTKYFGVNFLKQQKNYLEFRYLGGKNYEDKINDILELMEHFSLSIYNVLLSPDLTERNIEQLNNMMAKHKKDIRTFADFNEFILSHPKIKLMVDLKSEEQVLRSYYSSTLREKLYDLIVYCNFKSGILNYDRDISRFQVKDAVLTKCDNLKNVEIINCKADGMFYNCFFYNSTIEDSHIHNSDIMRTNIIRRSKVEKTPIHITNQLEECYIDNKNISISGKFIKCIIRNGEVSSLAKLIDTDKIED